MSLLYQKNACPQATTAWMVLPQKGIGMITNLFIGKERYLYIIYHIQASLSILINFLRFSSDTFCPRNVRKSIGSLSSIFPFAMMSSGIFPVSAAARSKNVYQPSEPFLILR